MLRNFRIRSTLAAAILYRNILAILLAAIYPKSCQAQCHGGCKVNRTLRVVHPGLRAINNSATFRVAVLDELLQNDLCPTGSHQEVAECCGLQQGIINGAELFAPSNLGYIIISSTAAIRCRCLLTVDWQPQCRVHDTKKKVCRYTYMSIMYII